MTNASRALDFNTLDDLAFAGERGRLSNVSLPTIAARDIGPVIEFAILAEIRKLPSPYTTPWLSLGGLAPLANALETGRSRWICPQSRSAGLLRTSPSDLQDPTIWTAFGLAAQQAATAAGFHRRTAAQLTAALGEFRSNIYEHANASHTGIVAFRGQPGQFEFVVADQGIGVLQSLRSAAAYAKLRDHGDALRLALSEGVSRYGPGVHRGYGFRPLFMGLANLKGSLRFRSGDHALLINGQDPTLMTARIAQKPTISGLLVSVISETTVLTGGS